MSMAIGQHTIEVTAYDAVGNQSPPKSLTVKRQGNVKGAVLIIAGRNDGNSLQSNIFNAANRAYCIFKQPVSATIRFSILRPPCRMRMAMGRRMFMLA